MGELVSILAERRFRPSDASRVDLPAQPESGLAARGNSHSFSERLGAAR
jgi:hypothetical protein